MSSFTTNITFGSAAELTSGAAACVGGGQKTLTGTVAGVGQTDIAAVAMGGAVATPTASNTGFTLTSVAGGPQDLLAVLSSQTFSGTSLVFAAKKGIIRRSLNLANNAAIPVLDFNAAEAFTPVSATLTMANGGTDLLSVALGYFTANGSSGSFTAGIPSNTATQTYYGVPAANQATGDFHALISSAIVVSGTSTTQIRSATKFFKTVADQTLTFGATPNAATVSAVATPLVARLRAQWNVQSDYNKMFTIGYSQTVGGIARSVNITATAASLGGSPTAIDITIPDFSGVTGFDAKWGLKAGTAVTWVTTSSGWTVAAGPFGGTPVEGGVVLSGTKSVQSRRKRFLIGRTTTRRVVAVATTRLVCLLPRSGNRRMTYHPSVQREVLRRRLFPAKVARHRLLDHLEPAVGLLELVHRAHHRPREIRRACSRRTESR